MSADNAHLRQLAQRMAAGEWFAAKSHELQALAEHYLSLLPKEVEPTWYQRFANYIFPPTSPNMPVPAVMICRWFVRKSNEKGPSITFMRASKLVYIAHGYHLGLYGTPLVDKHFRLASWGEMHTDLYKEFSTKYGVSRFMSNEPHPPALPEGTEKLLERVWEVFCKLPQGQLSALVLDEDGPCCTQNRRSLPSSSYDPDYQDLPIIFDDDIAAHFKKRCDTPKPKEDISCTRTS